VKKKNRRAARNYLLFFAPFGLAALVILILGSSLKSTYAEIDGTTSYMSFRLLGAWYQGSEIELIQSIPTNDFSLHAAQGDRFALAVMWLQDARTGERILEGGTIDFVARSGESSLQFEAAEGVPFYLVSIRVSTGSVASILVDEAERRLNLVLEPSEHVWMDLVFPDQPIMIRAYDFEVSDSNGQPLLRGDEQPQLKLTVVPQYRSTPISTATTLDLDLALPTAVDGDVFSRHLRVDRISFCPTEIVLPRGPVVGVVRFLKPDKPPMTVDGRYLQLGHQDILSIVEAGLSEEGMRMLLSGRVTTLQICSVPDGGVETLYTLLEWLYHHQQLAIAIAVLGWLSSAVIGGLKALPLIRGGGGD
jgi:hypothetical protein